MKNSEGGETLKKRRQTEILSIIAEYEVENQEMLQLLLKERGYNVTQATISRDINELNLEKNISKTGVSCYMKAHRINTTHYENIFRQSVMRIDSAGNIVCVKCRSGLASGACATLDSMNIEYVVGTISGDDTFFILVRTENDARTLVSLLKKMI